MADLLFREAPCEEHGSVNPHAFSYFVADRSTEASVGHCDGGTHEKVTIEEFYDALIDVAIIRLKDEHVLSPSEKRGWLASVLGITKESR